MYSEIIRFFLKSAPEVKDPPKIFMTDLQCVLSLVSSRARISLESITGRTQVADVVFARHCYFVIAREKTKASFAKIGKLVNKKHSNTLRCIKKAKSCPEFVAEFNRLFNDVMFLPNPVILKDKPVIKPKPIRKEVTRRIVEVFDPEPHLDEMHRPAPLQLGEYGTIKPMMGYIHN